MSKSAPPPINDTTAVLSPADSGLKLLAWNCLTLGVELFPWLALFLKYKSSWLIGRFLFFEQWSLRLSGIELLFSPAESELALQARYSLPLGVAMLVELFLLLAFFIKEKLPWFELRLLALVLKTVLNGTSVFSS